MKNLLLIAALVMLAACGSDADPNVDEQQTKTARADKAADTPVQNIMGKEVSYTSGDVTLQGYMAWDDSHDKARPGVLIVHEWWGHNDYVRERAHMLAEMGYTALAIDMYGDGKTADHPSDAQKFMMEVLNNMDSGVARFEAAKELLQNHASTDPQKTAAIGYCFGGAVVLHMARQGMDLAGVASFHGSLGTKSPAQPGQIKAEILVAHGGADPFVPEEQLNAFKEEMAAAEKDVTVLVYPDAKHGFTAKQATEKGIKFDMPLEYNESADLQSWDALQKFLANIF